MQFFFNDFSLFFIKPCFDFDIFVEISPGELFLIFIPAEGVIGGVKVSWRPEERIGITHLTLSRRTKLMQLSFANLNQFHVNLVIVAHGRVELFLF
jgi:hypothetical protein